jgi:hypothetical protein
LSEQRGPAPLDIRSAVPDRQTQPDPAAAHSANVAKPCTCAPSDASCSCK